MATLLVIGSGATLYGLYSYGGILRPGMRFLQDNLPLTLPILSVLMGVMLRPFELRSMSGWLNLSNHFAAGLVSFAIWAFVAGQTSGAYIMVNPDSVLDKEFALLLVFVSFIWAGFCSVVTALAEITGGRQQTVWRLTQTVQACVSVALLFAPIYLFENKFDVERRTGQSFDERPFTVVIPFRDPSLNSHLGRSSDPLTQSQVYRGITAKTDEEAIKKALTEFNKSEVSIQFASGGRSPDPTRRVEIMESYLVASPERPLSVDVQRP